MNNRDYWVNNYHKLTKEKMMKQLDAIIDSSFDGLWICDGEGRVIRVNKASEEINNIKAQQVLNRKMEDLVKDGLFDCSVTVEVLKARAAVTMIQQLENGKQVLVTGNPVFDSRGDIMLVVSNDRDITQLNQLRSELEKTRTLSREYRNELSQLLNQNKAFSDVIIRSESMHRVLHRAMKVAQVDSTVLIQGESGVGKGLFSRLIHGASDRKDGPFIRVDCAAIPETLIESELFGYEGGAFTGARDKGKLGHFELAENGTLFLDEVGSISLKTQVKLLRFIEDNEVIQVGGTMPRKVNARIIAATNLNLKTLIEDGRFRRDLFFRLNVVPLQIPPLRERNEDIPSLIHFFLERFNRKCATHKVIHPRVVDYICNYRFPGNIRELANLIEQLVVLSHRQHINKEDLPSHILRATTRQKGRKKRGDWNLSKAVAELERDRIIRALHTFGTQRKAAVHLGINQSTLARKVKKHHILDDAIMHHDA